MAIVNSLVMRLIMFLLSNGMLMFGSTDPPLGSARREAGSGPFKRMAAEIDAVPAPWSGPRTPPCQ